MLCVSVVLQDFCLIHKPLETHGRVLSIVGTDALVLKHQGISTHSADYMFIILV